MVLALKSEVMVTDQLGMTNQLGINQLRVADLMVEDQRA